MLSLWNEVEPLRSLKAVDLESRPEAWDGAPSIPQQTPATEATIKGRQVVPHTVIPILYIHNNHLQHKGNCYCQPRLKA